MLPNSTCDTGLVCTGGVCEMGIDIDAAVVHDSDVIHDAPLDGFLGHPDSSVIPDAAIPDSGVLPDAFIPDGGVLPDAGMMTDGGVTPDGTVMTDGGVTPDGTVMTDSGVLPDAGTGTCDPLAQTGCTSTQKCTWIDDTATTGHIGCVANGTMATGAACTFGAVGPSTGFDNCVRGDYCNGGKCETLWRSGRRHADVRREPRVPVLRRVVRRAGWSVVGRPLRPVVQPARRQRLRR